VDEDNQEELLDILNGHLQGGGCKNTEKSVAIIKQSITKDSAPNIVLKLFILIVS
jgi:hypothetical protein